MLKVHKEGEFTMVTRKNIALGLVCLMVAGVAYGKGSISIDAQTLAANLNITVTDAQKLQTLAPAQIAQQFTSTELSNIKSSINMQAARTHTKMERTGGSKYDDVDQKINDALQLQGKQ